MVKSKPKQTTVPSGPQSGERLRIMGITPTAAAIDVRKIGRMRRFPAAIAAASSPMPFRVRRPSA